MPEREQRVRGATRRWVEQVVVGLELCPFARPELERGTLRCVVSAATTESALLDALERELAYLQNHPDVETTLLIHPDVLQDFLDFNDFLGECDALLEILGLLGEFQLASFHPAYRFAGTGPEDAENFTNRSPYPMLHLLREASVTRAVDSHPAIGDVPRRNVARLRSLGVERLRALCAEAS